MMNEKQAADMLTSLGIDITDHQGTEYQALCPGHRERTGKIDSNPSWWFNYDSGLHFCFSCGYKGNTVSLVIDRLNLYTTWHIPDYEAAEEWVRSFSGLDLSKIAEHLEAVKEDYYSPIKPLEMTEARLAVFSDPPPWALNDRGLTAEACHAYGVRWDEPHQAWITPIRDPFTHKLWGWQVKGATTRLFLNRPLGVRKSQTLFGLPAWHGGRMIVVESPLDAARILSAGEVGAVATYGAVVSEAQIDLIRAADEVIVAFDNPAIDAAGNKATRQIYEAHRKFGFDLRVYDYGKSSAKDPGDQTDQQIQRGIRTARHAVLGLSGVLS